MKNLFKPLRQVVLRPRDSKRLAPHLASSGKLNELLVLDTITTEDLQRLLLLECSAARYVHVRAESADGKKGKWSSRNVAGRPRYVIVRKLVARILSRERDRMVKEAYGQVE